MPRPRGPAELFAAVGFALTAAALTACGFLVAYCAAGMLPD